MYKDNAEKEETGKIVKCLLVSYHKRFIHRGTCKDDISMKREMLSHFGLDLKCNLELVSLVKVWVVRGFSGIRPMMAIAPPPPLPMPCLAPAPPPTTSGPLMLPLSDVKPRQKYLFFSPTTVHSDAIFLLTAFSTWV